MKNYNDTWDSALGRSEEILSLWNLVNLVTIYNIIEKKATESKKVVRKVKTVKGEK